MSIDDQPASGTAPDDSQHVLDRLREYLGERGHSGPTIHMYLQAAEHFHSWLEANGKRLPTATEEEVGSFLSDHLPECSCPQPGNRKLRTVRPALRHLLAAIDRDKGSLEPSELPAPLTEELTAYAKYQTDLCGLSASTRIYRTRYAGEFLGAFFGEGPIHIPAIYPKPVMEWVAHRSRGCRPGTAGVIASSIRCYLRFCQYRGLLDERIIHAVPRIPRWRLSEVPRHLEEEELKRFLQSFDPRSASGCRDLAMALCMVEMGLRASEVARLEVQDIDMAPVGGTDPGGEGPMRTAAAADASNRRGNCRVSAPWTTAYSAAKPFCPAQGSTK